MKKAIMYLLLVFLLMLSIAALLLSLRFLKQKKQRPTDDIQIQETITQTNIPTPIETTIPQPVWYYADHDFEKDFISFLQEQNFNIDAINLAASQGDRLLVYKDKDFVTSASVVKMALGMMLEDLVHAGTITWDTAVTYTIKDPEDDLPPAKSPAEIQELLGSMGLSDDSDPLPDPEPVVTEPKMATSTIRALTEDMIVNSSNEATDILHNYLVSIRQPFFKNYIKQYTYLKDEPNNMEDPWNKDNKASALYFHDAIRWIQEHRENYEILTEFMTRSHDRFNLKKTPSDITKAGWLGLVENVAIVILDEEEPLYLCLLAEQSFGSEQMGRITQFIRDSLKKENSNN